MKVLLVGLWARRGSNAAALMMTVIALTCALLGPMYGRASAEHLVDTRIGEQPTYATGLSVALPAMEAADLSASARFEPPVPQALVDEAAAVLAGPGVERFWGPERRWLRDPGYRLIFNDRVLAAPLYWREGMCDLAEVTGRCPTGAREVLLQATMAETMGVTAGDEIRLGFQELYLKARRVPGGFEEVEQSREGTAAFEVVGTYRITDPTSPAWYDESRFVGFDKLNPSAATGPQASADPPTPALLVAPETMTSQTFVGGVDRVVQTSAVDLDSMAATGVALGRFTDRVLDSRSVNPGFDQQLASIFDDVTLERSLLSRVLVAAIAPLVVLALMLLFALVSAGAAARRPYVSLAKLRGHSRAQVFRFAVGEPLLVVAAAVPIAVALAVAAAHLVARMWLADGIPIQPDATAWTALAVVAAAAATASIVAAFDVIREPLSKALASAVGLRASSRAALILRVAVVAVAVVAVLQLLTSGDQSSQLLALLSPMFVALAVAVAGASLLRMLSRRWVRRTEHRSGTASYLASRRLARRPDLTNLMVPLLLAVSMIMFAGSASAVSADWRESRARAEVGAAQTFRTEVSPGRLLDVTRDVDPDGRYLAAALVQRQGDDLARRLFVDSSRLAAVAAWDPSWSDVPVAALADRLQTDADERVTFQGSRVSVTVGDVDLKSTTESTPVLWLQYVDDDGEQRNAELGPLRNGDRSVTLTATTRGCASACAVDRLFLAGESLSVLDANGRLRIVGVAVDGRAMDWGLSDPDAWRPARPFPVSLVDPPVVLGAQPDGLVVDVYLGQLPPGEGAAPTMLSGFAGITPAATPDVVPVVVAADTRTSAADRPGSGTSIDYDGSVVAGVGLNGEAAPMAVVAEVAALPKVGSSGAMADLETSLVEFEPPAGAVLLPELWAAADTPKAVFDEVRNRGVALTPVAVLGDTLDELNQDAFSLGLRLFLLVGFATLLLAVFGVFASSVVQTAWRSYEVASLRVVGVSQRSLVLASVLEYVMMLGLAVGLGIGSALVATRLVLPAINLGPVDDFAPAPDYTPHWFLLAGAGTALFLLAGLIALLVSRRTTRLGRPATLRWAEQG